MQTFIVSALAVMAAATGQVAKFESRPPSAEYVSATSIGDAERCLIRVAAPPLIYRQPDRPDDVSIVWGGVSVSAGNAVARIDLHRESSGTRVRVWGLDKQALDCAPKLGDG